MAKITHPEMSRGQDVSMPPSKSDKVFVVEDFSNAAIDQKLAEFEGTTIEAPVVQAPVEFVPPKKENEELKKSLEKLIFMGRFNKEIMMAGHKFEISTLTHKENNIIVRKLMSFGDASDLFTIRALTLSYALRSIDGISLDDIEIEGKFEDSMHKRMTIIDNMQLTLVEKLNTEYENLVKEADKLTSNENIKN